MKSRLLLKILMLGLLLPTCVSLNDSERMEEALAQGEVLYGQGENDSLVFVPGLEQAASYFAERKQYSKAAHAALYNGYAELAAHDKVAAMHSFKEAEQYGGQANDSLTVSWAQYEMGRLLCNEERTEEALSILRESDTNFGSFMTGRALAYNLMACSYLIRNCLMQM